jgi:uncharacterized protein YbcV (DUF1398 family)
MAPVKPVEKCTVTAANALRVVPKFVHYLASLWALGVANYVHTIKRRLNYYFDGTGIQA